MWATQGYIPETTEWLTYQKIQNGIPLSTSTTVLCTSPTIWRESFGELCVGFVKNYQCSFTDLRCTNKQRIFYCNLQ